jgi:hypothetical protein
LPAAHASTAPVRSASSRVFRQQLLFHGAQLISERTLADHGVEHEATLQLLMRVDGERAQAIEANMPIMTVAALGAGLHIDFLDDLYELGFDNDTSIPLL